MMEVYSENDWAELNDWIQLIISAKNQGFTKIEVRTFLGLLSCEAQSDDAKMPSDEPASTPFTKTVVKAAI